MKVLVVDDSSMMRMILRKELERSGFEVFEAKNGIEALEKASEIKPQLITIDVDMPQMNGFEAVQKIRTELKLMIDGGDKEIPIIFVTANDTLEGRKEGFKVGATDFIIKPFLRGEVAAAVNNLLHPDTTLQGMTVLVAEDSGLTRSILNNILQGEGINTILADNGQEALEILKNQEQDIDLVMTDLMMPEMNGDELCKRIRIELGNKSLPVIFLSAMSETSSILKIFKAGASDYIIKPFAKEELLSRIRVHLESRLLNKKLFEQVHELKRLNKLKDDILSITSHDLRSPLNGVLGFTDLLMQDKTLNDTHQEYLKHIKDSGGFLLSLINDILDLGRAQSEQHELEMNVISVSELIESSIITVRHMATPKKISIEIENRCDFNPCVMGDRNALIRIFNNLLANAIKFTHKDGVVKQIIELENEKTLKISVVDDGIGIPPDKIPFLFDKFSKASRPGTSGEKSTGLGLSITKELIERHKGSIHVISKEGEGSCFYLLLPLVNPDSPQEEEEERTDKIDEDNPVFEHRVLIVDDNRLNIKLAKTVFNKQGFRIESAENGKKAVEAYIKSLEKDEDRLDAIFMDIRMPVMDGFEATVEIRKYEQLNRLNRIPIIAMTAGMDDFWKNRSHELGLNGFIAKPIDLKQIKEITRQLLHIDKD
ncbi:response regulator [bacterium]|nr:response regulator [bacterium]